MDVLIGAAELKGLVDSAQRVVILDVRWQLGGPPGHGEYLRGHIPGAVYVDLSDELAGHGAPADGRHPLPERADLQASARRWGIRTGDRVVAHDDSGNLAAARAWWLLRRAGVDVQLLDGGLRAWVVAGGELATDDVRPEPGDVRLTEGGGVLPLERVAAFADSGRLLDARAGERYRGENEPIDPVAGHIPGALSVPTFANLDPEGRFLAPALLRERFGRSGVDGSAPVAVYCGSGVTAAHEVAALAIVGIDADLYPGSWSQWCNHPELPVAIGAEP